MAFPSSSCGSATRPAAKASIAAGKASCSTTACVPNGYFLSCAYTRNKQGPWALDGGNEGSTNRIEVIRADGTVEEHAYVTNLALNEGDIVRVRTAHGGGHGDPRERSRDLVRDDLRNEYISAETARDVYGVDFSAMGGHGT